MSEQEWKVNVVEERKEGMEKDFWNDLNVK